MGQTPQQRRAQQRRAQERLQREIERAAAQRQKAEAVAAKEAARAARLAHQVERIACVEKKNLELTHRNRQLGSILTSGLTRTSRLNLDRRRESPREFEPDLGELGNPADRPHWAAFNPKPPGAISRAFGGQERYAIRLQTAKNQFQAAQLEWEGQEFRRQAAVRDIRKKHSIHTAQIRDRARVANHNLSLWVKGIAARHSESVERYLLEVVERTPLPIDFPRKCEITFQAGRDGDGDEACVRYQLPGTGVVPIIQSFSYIKTRDEVSQKERPAAECASTYRSVVAQVSLLVIRDLFEADENLQQVTFSGHVDWTNPANGREEFPCLISTIVGREEYSGLILNRVSAEDCLRHLKALVSQHPYKVEAVRPVIDFDLTKYPLVDGVDVVSSLDHRDDLMTLTPTEFEHVTCQLFEAMPGLKGWATQASRDDGVDAVIVNYTPVTGGLTVIQAKRYKNKVGPSHVRELAGTMEDKKAGRGVLVTTSTFTKDARLASKRHGRIELIDGPMLVHLFREHLDKDVLIGLPPT
jgi:restriction system protein